VGKPFKPNGLIMEYQVYYLTNTCKHHAHTHTHTHHTPHTNTRTHPAHTMMHTP